MKEEKLKKEVERVVGHELREARDFEELSQLLLIRYARETVTYDAQTILGLPEKRERADTPSYTQCAGPVCRL